MDRSQIAGIAGSLLVIIVFVFLFHKNKQRNHHQDLKDEVIESKIEEQNFEKAGE